jgi:arylsulfatase A-like enzyme
MQLALFAAGLGLVMLGPGSVSRVDTRGLERNSLAALIRTSRARVTAASAEGDWRASPLGGDADLPPRFDERSENLGSLRGVAAGRNVLMVVLESTGARYLKPYGAAEDPTPNLSSLAEQSIVFDNAYAVYPESIKGLAAILASRYPGFDVPAEAHSRLMSPSLATVLARDGYETALFHSGRFLYLGMDTVLAGAGFGRLEDAGDIGGNRSSSFGIDEAAAVHRVLQWIDHVPHGRRFFATYLPIAGHHPYGSAAPAPFPTSQEIGRYRNALYEGDRALGDLFAGLRSRGLDTSTVVVVMGDHAEAFGQHDGNYGHTLALYDENVRVPLIISVPGARAAIGHVHRTASLLDVSPTILDLLGVRQPGVFEGASLLDGHDQMALFFTDYSLGLLGLRDGCLKYIYELEVGRSKAFDLCRDPNERIDLAPSLGGRVSLYRERLTAWSAAEVARVRQVDERGSDGGLLGAFFALSVSDVGATSAWYRDNLGFRVLTSGEAPNGIAKFAILRDSAGSIIEMIQHREARPLAVAAPSVTGAHQIHGIFKIGFHVADIDQAYRQVKAVSVPIAYELGLAKDVALRSFTIRDREGNMIQFFGK